MTRLSGRSNDRPTLRQRVCELVERLDFTVD
jgi:hypothetical protein